MIIEPCCAPKQLPSALKASPTGAVVYHTNGDVTFEKLYHSIAYLIESPAVMVLTLPFIDVPTLRYLDHCFNRGWITDLILTTQQPSLDLVRKVLSEHQSHVSYISYERISPASSSLTLFSDTQSLIVNGEIPLTSQNTLIPNILIYYASSSLDMIRGIIAPVLSLHRISIKRDKSPRSLSPRLQEVLSL